MTDAGAEQEHTAERRTADLVPPPGDLLAIVVEVVSDVATLKATVAGHENRLVGAEGSIITLSGQVDEVADKADRTEKEVTRMSTSMDTLVATASRLETGQAGFQQTMDAWTPQLVGLRALLEAKAVTDQDHLAELRVIARQQEESQRRQRRFQQGARIIGAVAAGIITVGGVTTALVNMRPIWHWTTQYPPLAISGVVAVVLLVAISGAFLFRVLPWPG